LNTLNALETYLDDFNGVLVVVSHDRFFTDKVTNHLFVFEGNGEVKDFAGSLSEYADCLFVQENMGSGDSGDAIDTTVKKAVKKEDQQQRNERRNAVRKMKKEMVKLEHALEKLKPQAAALQSELERSGDGWTVLAELTEKLDECNRQIDQKEMQWLEIAEELEMAEAEDLM
jgi:ABC transport system ATP-binding/permease protein